jgi:hypothetical protein
MYLNISSFGGAFICCHLKGTINGLRKEGADKIGLRFAAIDDNLMPT